MKQVHIFGGGTVSHVRNHLALCMPAYGETARTLSDLVNQRFPDCVSVLHLTKMATGGQSKIETNEDVNAVVDDVVANLEAKVVFFNVALCDFAGAIQGKDGHITKSGKYEPRLSSKNEDRSWMHLQTQEKILSKIRATRKDIFLVAFKTTCGATEDEQYAAGLHLLKANSCNLVLANDTKTRVNMIITPEEARYHVTTDRYEALRQLVDMAFYRSHLSFTRSTVVAGDPVPWDSEEVPSALRAVVNHCINSNAYKPFRGATVGHFACAISDTEFLTSIRKSNFNDLASKGLVRVKTDGPDTVLAYGMRPSVGGQSQRIVFSEHPGYDCIVHFHCPIKEGSKVTQISQREYECGSHQCGQRTSTYLTDYDGILAVYLQEHGPNVVFPRSMDPQKVIDFIEANFDLSAKTGGLIP